VIHSSLGASGAHRWLPCPGSLREAEGIPDETSAYAAEGTAAHALLEQCLTLAVPAEQFVGEVMGGFEIKKEMAEAVQVAVDYVNLRLKTAQGMYLETVVSLAPLDPPVEMFGTADVVLIFEDMIEVVDLKFGAGVFVDAVDNEQGAYYLSGAALQFPPKGQYRFTVVQPRIDWNDDGPVRSWDLDTLELAEWMDRLIAGARAALAPDAPLVPGKKQCKFCRAKKTCSALRESVNDMARSTFDIMAPPAPETLAELLDKADAAEEQIKALRAFAYRELETGRDVPGWKLVEKRATRKWASEDEILIHAKRRGQLRKVTKTVLLSPAQAEKTGYRPPQGAIVKESSGYNMVRDTDKRAAISAGPQNTFDALEPAP